MVSSPVLITFVVPVRNDAQRLERCLLSIAADTTAAPHTTLVIDNDSTDDSAAVARRLGATVLTMPGGVAVLRNAGVAQTTARFVAFVDADHQIASGWTAAALSALADAGVAAVGAPYHAPENGTWVQRAYDGLRRHPRRVEPAEWFGAGNLVVRRDAFDAVGGFDVALESCEDVDLCARLRADGWRLLSVPAMRSVHYGDPPTLGRVFWSELWRGRDNFRVSLRAPWSLRNTVSLAIPIVELIAAPLAIAGLLWWWPLGLAMLALLLALIGLRVTSLLLNTGGATRRLEGSNSMGLRDVSPAGAGVPDARSPARWGGGGGQGNAVSSEAEPGVLVRLRRSLTRIAAAVAVAIAYDAGRALALVARAGHHRRAPVAQTTT